MKKIGSYMAIFGVLAIGLPFFDLQLRFLSWIDMWGETVSWAIKIGLIVVGAILFFVGSKQDADPSTK